MAEIEPHLAAGRAAGLEHLDAADHRAGRERLAARRTSSACTSSPPSTRCRCWRSSRARRPATPRVYRALDLAKQIGKTPIVVNDSRGFFTSPRDRHVHQRGHGDARRGHPRGVDRAGLLAGRLPGARAAALRRAEPEADAADPQRRPRPPRRPRAAPGSRTPPRPSSTAWSTSSSAPASSRARASTSTPTASARGCGRACARRSRRSPTRPRSRSGTCRSGCCSSRPSRRVKCLDEGVIESVADANIGSIMGIGFPGWTGGVLQYINGYEGGLPGFVARARELAEQLRRALHAARVAGRARRAGRELPDEGSWRRPSACAAAAGSSVFR